MTSAARRRRSADARPAGRTLSLENGVVRTLDAAGSVRDRIAIGGDLVLEGVDAGASGCERVDLRGRCVVPGFSDSHVHFPTWAMAQRWVRLESCRSLEEAVRRVAGAAAAHPGGWLMGYGWRSGDWPSPCEPTKSDLDPVCAETPVALWSRDYHSLWLNSAGLARARDDLGFRDGLVPTGADGEPTGVLREHAAWRFRDRHVRFTTDEYASATADGVAIAHARGVTAVHDKDGWLDAPAIWRRVHERAPLTLRVWQSLPYEQAMHLDRASAQAEVGGGAIRLGYLKAFMDGSLGSATALMLDGSGISITSGEELAEIVRAAARSGWPVSVHAIGDRANREALDAFAATRDVWHPLGLRQRIEHAQHLHPDDIPRFARIGVACSVQFSHAPADRELVDRLDPELRAGSYAFRSLRNAGAVLANGSDAPIDELDPLRGIRAGALRTLDERPAWRGEEAVTVEDALRATTVAPAWLCGDEHRRGRLVPGWLADLVVLDRDPVACAPEELPEVRVVATMVGGRWVHGAPPWD